MSDIETRPLFTMQIKGETQPLGQTHGVERQVVILTECIIGGDRIKGRVLPGGSDWLTVEPDGAVLLDCRMVIQTDDGPLESRVLPEFRLRMRAGMPPFYWRPVVR
jgi:Protein of unknown function (DUF3237)